MTVLNEVLVEASPEDVSANPTIFTANVKKYLSTFSSILRDKDEVTVATTAARPLKRPLVAHCGRA